MGVSGRVGARVTDALQQMLAQAMLERRQQFDEERQLRAEGQDAARFTEDTRRFDVREAGDAEERAVRTQDRAERTRTLEAALKRQTAQDEIAAGARRRTANDRGVLDMAAEGVEQGTVNPRESEGRRTLGAMLMRAGEGKGLDLLTQETPEEEQRRDDAQWKNRADYQEGQLRSRPVRTQTDDPQWVVGPDGKEAYRVPRDGDMRPDPVAARKAPDGPSAYADEKATRTLQSVDELIGKVNRWTTGIGSVLSRVPESDARNFATELDTLKANIAFNELAQMREASKTGGALGSVSNVELNLLQSSLGALDTGQSPDNLKTQLVKIRGNVTRWQEAVKRGTGAASAGDAGGRVEYVRDSQGRLVRKR